MATGIFMRVQRDGRWENLDLSDMTEEETRDALSGKPAEWLIRCIAMCAKASQLQELDADASLPTHADQLISELRDTVSSVQLDVTPGHDVLRIWNRNGLAGQLVLKTGDGDRWVNALVKTNAP